MAEGIVFRFSNEEMVYLLRALAITDFPGLAPEPLKQLANSEKSLVMMEADRTLRARGLVSWHSTTQREIAPLIGTVLNECARPRYTLFMDRLEAGGLTTQCLYLFGTTMTVEQCETEPGVQQYLVMPSREAFLQRLRAVVMPASDDAPASLPDGDISAEVCTQALALARTDPKGARKLLARSLPRQTAEALAAAAQNRQRIHFLALWRETPAVLQAPLHTLMIVAGSGQVFLLWREDPKNISLQVLPAGTERIWEYVTQLIAPAEPHAIHSNS